MKTHGFKAFPLFCVRDFARQLLDVLDFIHSFGLIHTDLKPENILLNSNKERPYRLPDGSDQQVPAFTSIKLIDFGGATYDRDKKSTVINTRQYRGGVHLQIYGLQVVLLLNSLKVNFCLLPTTILNILHLLSVSLGGCHWIWCLVPRSLELEFLILMGGTRWKTSRLRANLMFEKHQYWKRM
jgi:serine/threonine protein kinase